jgi:hypothetical protein
MTDESLDRNALQRGRRPLESAGRAIPPRRLDAMFRRRRSWIAAATLAATLATVACSSSTSAAPNGPVYRIAISGTS